jgi:hypothetical protein
MLMIRTALDCEIVREESDVLKIIGKIYSTPRLRAAEII